MKKKYFALALIIVVALIGAGGGYYWRKKVNAPPKPFTYQTREDLDKAIKKFEEDGKTGKSKWQDRFNLGVAYIYAERFEDAVKTFEEVKNHRPSFNKTYEALGMAYYRLDNTPKAVEAWQKALELDPSAEHLKDMLERAKRRLEIKNRVVALKQEIAKGPAGWTKRLELAALHLMLREPEPAIIELKEVLKTRKNSPEIYDALAEAYALKGDFDNAVFFEKKAVSLSPGDEVLKKRLSEMQKIREAVKKGEYRESVRPPQADEGKK